MSDHQEREQSLPDTSGERDQAGEPSTTERRPEHGDAAEARDASETASAEGAREPGGPPEEAEDETAFPEERGAGPSTLEAGGAEAKDVSPESAPHIRMTSAGRARKLRKPVSVPCRRAAGREVLPTPGQAVHRARAVRHGFRGPLVAVAAAWCWRSSFSHSL